MKDVEQNLVKNFCYKTKIFKRRFNVQIIRNILQLLKAIEIYLILKRKDVTERKKKGPTFLR